MKVIFKPTCEKCGFIFNKLEYQKGTRGVYISPSVCPKCRKPITQIELPAINENGFIYGEGGGN